MLSAVLIKQFIIIIWASRIGDSRRGEAGVGREAGVIMMTGSRLVILRSTRKEKQAWQNLQI